MWVQGLREVDTRMVESVVRILRPSGVPQWGQTSTSSTRYGHPRGPGDLLTLRPHPKVRVEDKGGVWTVPSSCSRSGGCRPTPLLVGGRDGQNMIPGVRRPTPVHPAPSHTSSSFRRDTVVSPVRSTRPSCIGVRTVEH